jgi:hypothetical protein
MKHTVLFFLMFVVSIVAPAVRGEPGSKIQEGQRAVATLLATARVMDKAVPDGVRFLVLVAPKVDTTGQFTLKETRDFKVVGESYQEKTKAELGKQFEPQTTFDSAEGFFKKQPGMRALAPDNIQGAYILTIAIGGAKLATDTKGEITVNVGFDQQLESFTFQFAVPPDRSVSPKP